jgi:UDP-N-acetylglucosamine 2-epimerase (non-hydrolysing)
MKKKIAIIIGTRPDFIKLFPLILELKQNSKFDVLVFSSGQHKEMLNQLKKYVKIKIDYDFSIMTKNQSLNDLTSNLLSKASIVLSNTKLDGVVVQGDTTTAFVFSLAAFYLKIPVFHVEAGLRTNDLYSPFPEELNRTLISKIAALHFTPTDINKKFLLNEGHKPKNIITVGNTVIDSLKYFSKQNINFHNNYLNENIRLKDFNKYSRFSLITIHRRENFGANQNNTLLDLKKLAINFKDIAFLFPVHLNPNIKENVHDILGEMPNIFLVDPIEYPIFISLLKECSFVITDSGGIQEETPFFKKPLFVVRDSTERSEIIKLKLGILVGTKKGNLYKIVQNSIKNNFREFNFKNKNPYGDGTSSVKISRAINQYFK